MVALVLCLFPLYTASVFFRARVRVIVSVSACVLVRTHPPTHAACDHVPPSRLAAASRVGPRWCARPARPRQVWVWAFIALLFISLLHGIVFFVFVREGECVRACVCTRMHPSPRPRCL